MDDIDYSSFDWPMFLANNGVAYVERGKNVARASVNVRCPFCAGADPSEHMGLSLVDSKWGCWRDPQHRGRKPHFLIKELLSCTYKEADVEARKYLREAPEEFADIKAYLIKATKKLPPWKPPKPEDKFAKEAPHPPHSFHVERAAKSGRPAIAFLRKRGFTHQSKKFCWTYAIRYAAKGPFRNRVIFPVIQGGMTRGYIGRTIVNDDRRYLVGPTGYSLKDCVWNYDRCWRAARDGRARGGRQTFDGSTPIPRGTTLILCEGVFDAAKLDFYGAQYGVRALALLTSGLGKDKMAPLIKLARRYPRVLICLDKGAETNAAEIESQLAVVRARCLWLPEGFKDTGEFTPMQAGTFALNASRT